MLIVNIIIFVFILGIIVFIHELGHYLFAKKAGIYVYEFSIGMGPKIKSFKRKNDETEYFIKALPIGGYVKLAGEEIEEDKNIPKGKRLQNKTFTQRLLVMIAGASFNFLLSIFILFVIGIFYGAEDPNPYVGELKAGYNAIDSGLQEGDKILEVGKYKIKSEDDLIIVLVDSEYIKNGVKFKVEGKDNKSREVFVVPTKETIDGEDRYVFGFVVEKVKLKGFINTIKYPFIEFGNTIKSMVRIIGKLFNGSLGLNNLAGPVGIYSTVEASVDSGLQSTLTLIAFLGINVGFINLIPFPAFDGGRVLFLIIEKIRRKPLTMKVENTANLIGFIFLMLLMVLVTIGDVGRLMGR